MIRFFILILSLFASPAFAQGFPDAFITRDVPSDDRLNIRAEPSASAPIIGDYYAFTTNIEVLRTSSDGKWGMVGIGERNGWVSMRYLERSNHNEPHRFPRPISCSGTEPFWNLNVTMRGDEYSEMGMDRRDLNMISDSGAPNGGIAVFEEGPTLNRTLIVQRGYCGDGMSDREFGWKATLFTEAPDGNYAQSGCCTLDANN
ncbi:hypothetical protein [Yoonia sp. 208BN28-4]|uniref:hypothetical protein n=1 Tax=Yoonia sp. 208BN28-4 TaxID=3126505 RepID=UPI00309CBDF4